MIPMDAIDPDALYREWAHELEHHLNVVPRVMYALVALDTPSIRASQTDKIVVTGGGYIDNVPDLDEQVRADAGTLWAWLIEFIHGAAAQIDHRPVPDIPPVVPGDATAAHDAALLAVGWLIDHSRPIWGLGSYLDPCEELFRLIRRYRRVYGIHPRPRFHPAPCVTCGERQVIVDYSDEGRVGVCRRCGESWEMGARVVQEEGTAA